MGRGPEPGFWKVFFAVCSVLLRTLLSGPANKKRRKSESNPSKTLTDFWGNNCRNPGFPVKTAFIFQKFGSYTEKLL
jgi:hypothetical protein